MEQDQRHLDLAELVKKLRYTTVAVQIMPFVYTVLYLISILSSFVVSEETMRSLDSLFYVSPVVVAGMLLLSKLLRLCRWHKTACLLPVIPQVVSFVDYYIIELSELAAQVNVILFSSMAILLLVAAYNVFFR